MPKLQRIIKRTIPKKDRWEKIAEEIRIVDEHYRPDLKLYEKNPKRYLKEYALYEKMIRVTAQRLKNETNYKKDRNDPDPSKIALDTAQSYFSEARRIVLDRWNFLPPHFFDELDELIEAHPKHKKALSNLKKRTKNPKVIDIAMNTLTKDVLPSYMFKKAKALPHQHPAGRYLNLPKAQSAIIKRERIVKSKKKHWDAVSIEGREISKFVWDTFDTRHHSSWEDILISLQITTGRRKPELGFMSQLKESDIDGHIWIDKLAKIRRNARNQYINVNLDIPVIILSPEEVLELYKVLQKKLLKEIFISKSTQTNIKRAHDTKWFDNKTYTVRDVFKHHFYYVKPSKKSLTVHQGCRSMYVNAGFEVYGNTPRYQHMDLLAYANTVLGHKDKELDASAEYVQVKVIGSVMDYGLEMQEVARLKNQTIVNLKDKSVIAALLKHKNRLLIRIHHAFVKSGLDAYYLEEFPEPHVREYFQFLRTKKLYQ